MLAILKSFLKSLLIILEDTRLLFNPESFNRIFHYYTDALTVTRSLITVNRLKAKFWITVQGGFSI